MRAVVSGVGLLAAVSGYEHTPLDAIAGLATGAAVTIGWVLLLDMSVVGTVRRERRIT